MLPRLLNRRRNSFCYRTLHRLPTPGMSFPISLESCIPRPASRGEFPNSIEPFIFLRGRKCSFQLTTQLPTEVTVGLMRLWTQVQNLTKLWILWLYCAIPKKECQIAKALVSLGSDSPRLYWRCLNS